MSDVLKRPTEKKVSPPFLSRRAVFFLVVVTVAGAATGLWRGLLKGYQRGTPFVCRAEAMVEPLDAKKTPRGSEAWAQAMQNSGDLASWAGPMRLSNYNRHVEVKTTFDVGYGLLSTEVTCEEPDWASDAAEMVIRDFRFWVSNLRKETASENPIPAAFHFNESGEPYLAVKVTRPPAPPGKLERLPVWPAAVVQCLTMGSAAAGAGFLLVLSRSFARRRFYEALAGARVQSLVLSLPPKS